MLVIFTCKKPHVMIKSIAAMAIIIFFMLSGGYSFAKTTDIATLKLLVANESYDDALALLRKKHRKDDRNPELWYLGGIIHNRMMRQDSALVYFKHAALLDSADQRIAGALASVYASLRQSANAREIYREMIARDSTALMPYIHLASLHMRDNEPRAALEIYMLLHSKEPSNQGFVKSIGDCYRRTGNDMAAVKYYRKANAMNSSDLSVNLALANLYAKMKDYDKGLEIAEAGLVIDTNHAELLFWSGFFNYALGRHSQAVTRLKQAEDNGNESLLVHQFIGICYYFLGNFENARDYLELAIRINVNDYRLFTYLGKIYRYLADYEISEKYFFNALEVLKPDSGAIINTYLNLVDTYRVASSFGKMADAYTSALEYDRNNPFLHYGLAYTFDNHLGENNKALLYYNAFVEHASKESDPNEELMTLIDYARARIRGIREDRFFE